MTAAAVRFWHVARVTIEFRTPFLVAASEDSLLADASPVLDANDLPVIPGTSLAGVLRHAFEKERGPERTAEFFGGPSYADEQGTGSRLWFTWAHIHDQHDRPVDGLRFSAPEDDPVLARAMSPVVRDHVRISHRGAADPGGKFDQALVCAGHRFTFEMRLEADARHPGDEEAFDWLLRCLAGGGLRLGGGGRRGLGGFRVVRCLKNVFDLSSDLGRRSFLAHPCRLDRPAGYLEPFEIPLGDLGRGLRVLELPLRAVGFWGFNGAEPWDPPASGNENAPDFNPVREERIVWDGSKGKVADAALFIPGSSLKGVISHRVAFHDNRIRKRFADEADDAVLDDWTGDRNPSVRELFGSMHRREGDSPGEARAGRIHLDDIRLEETPASQVLNHVGIDRFTGGARAGILFSERVLFQGPPLKLRIETEGWDSVGETAREALREALRDLCEGRLTAGAGFGRGHGQFRLHGDRPFDELWTEAMEGGVHAH